MLEERVFHLTGTITGTSLLPVHGSSLRPALLARLRDLARLRYAYPLVLVEDDARLWRSLSEVVDAACAEVAPHGPAGDRVRRAALRAEREIRGLLDAGTVGTLRQVWDLATDGLAVRGGDALRADLATVRRALVVDGQLVGCGAGTAARVVAHAWRLARRSAAAEMRGRIERLLVRAGDLDRADFLRSAEGVRAEVLAAGVGAPHRGLFDFDLMAHLLVTPAGASGMTQRRRRRIERAEAVLGSQMLFDPERVPVTYHAVDAAISAARTAIPTLVEVAQSMATLDLEAAGRYDESAHDPWIASLAELGPEELAWSPDRIVALGPEAATATGRARILEALASGVPLKVVVEIDDVFGPAGRLAPAATALGDAFVVQASAAALPDLADGIRAALAFAGPALVCVYSGAVRDDLPPYLVAGAATTSRTFPTFTFDPSSQGDPGRAAAAAPHPAPPSTPGSTGRGDGRGGWRLGAHPQPDREWARERFTYADERLQRRSLDLAFTPVDLALCDPRWASSFALVERDRWDRLAPVETRLDGADTTANAAPPAVYAVDADDRLRMLVVDERLIRAARHAAEAWTRLVAMTSVRPSVGETPPSGSGARPPGPLPSPNSSGDGPLPSVRAPEGPLIVAEGSADAAYIETARCSSCNECTLVNPRMFKYDGNKQAYIADRRAGTYRDLVEAAERCQVAIIHPGKPLDPSEPGLDELLERAAALA